MRAWQSTGCNPPGLAVQPPPSERSQTKLNANRRLLYTFKPLKLLGYWTKAY